MKPMRQEFTGLGLLAIALLTACNNNDDRDSIALNTGGFDTDGLNAKSVLLGERPTALAALLL